MIPTVWADAHRPTIRGTWTGECTIRRPGGTQGEFDPETGTYPTVPHDPHHTGKCRVQVQPIFSADRETGGQEVTVAGYLVVVDRDTSTETAVGDICKMTAVDDNGDPALVGRELTVSGVAYGSLAWERDLTAIDNLG